MATRKEIRKDPKEYMKLAVEIMKKSIPERKKKDPSPYVGAVLVFPDGTVETAFRGELREGDHAEYTLLDKKHRQRELSDCWLKVPGKISFTEITASLTHLSLAA